MPTQRKILRRHEVQDLTGLPRSTLYRMISEGRFPGPVKLSERSVGWDSILVHAWLEQVLAPEQAANG